MCSRCSTRGSAHPWQRSWRRRSSRTTRPSLSRTRRTTRCSFFRPGRPWPASGASRARSRSCSTPQGTTLARSHCSVASRARRASTQWGMPLASTSRGRRSSASWARSRACWRGTSAGTRSTRTPSRTWSTRSTRSTPMTSTSLLRTPPAGTRRTRTTMTTRRSSRAAGRSGRPKLSTGSASARWPRTFPSWTTTRRWTTNCPPKHRPRRLQTRSHRTSRIRRL
mmetsp:Transcript_74303/g.197389  ORF Transcript_74303/g.197389 Transcript_74303/m.197389 type:complete len:224 (+) Transcript_74303:346-1017(+)